MNALLQQFIFETRDLIEEASKGFLYLERNPDDQETIGSIFRAVHTIKGSSGLFDLKSLTQVVHAAEDVLDALRAGQITLDSEIVDMILDSLDLVTGWLDSVESDEKLPVNAEVIADDYAKKLRVFLDGVDNDVDLNGFSLVIQEDKNYRLSLPILSRLSEEERLKIFKHLDADNRILYLLEYTPESGCFFTGDDPLNLVSELKDVWTMRIKPLSAFPTELTAEFDPFNCNLNIKIVTSATREEIDEVFGYVPQSVKLVRIAPEALIIPQGDQNGGPVYEDFVEEATEFLHKNDFDALLRATSTLLELSNGTLWLASILRWLKTMLECKSTRKESMLALVHSLQAMSAPLFPAVPVIEENPLDDVISEVDSKTATASSGSLVDSIGNTAPTSTANKYRTVCHIVQEQIHILDMPCDQELILSRIVSGGQVVKNCLLSIEQPALLSLVDDAIATGKTENSISPLKKVFEQLLEEFSETTQTEQANILMHSITEGIHPVLEEAKKIVPVEGVGMASKPKSAETTPPVKQQIPAGALDDIQNGDHKGSVVGKILKIDQAKIDKLMDLIGELVVAKNSLPYVARRAEINYGVRDLAREIKDQYAVINRITQEMQSNIMQVRMLPVSHVFNRFPSLVRSISRKLGKQVNLVIEGETTEADKNVIEQLFDPLLHIVRNSIDHGFEMPDERKASGKLVESILKMRALRENDNVVIEIIDDGKGIDPVQIKKKAYEKGLLDEAKLATISDDEAIQLVFAAGFSTAEAITDISGRGVGMDVVRSVIQKANGSVRLLSEKGKGTTVRLALPLSMAITRVMTIEVAQHIFGVPMDIIIETVHIHKDDIHIIKDREAFVLRNRIVPLIRLSGVLQLKGMTTASRENKESDFDEFGELSILVVRLGNEDVGIVVDEFHEGVEIILKPMDGILANLPGYSGTALLGDGRVLLVLNLKEII